MATCGTITREDLIRRQSFPIDVKIKLSKERIKQWYEHYDGLAYISFSGGKDSTVLLDLVKSLYPDVPAVFCDTGLEYPELREFARSRADIVLKPKMNFRQVIDRYGYPVIGKKQARMIRDLQHESDRNRNVCNLHRTGYTKEGLYCPNYKLADKWLFMADAPFKVSEQCCTIMKKQPFAEYESETGRKPFIGTMAWESSIRATNYMKNGCNAFDTKRPNSTPMSFWTEQDVLLYLKEKGLEYASVYGDIIEQDDGLHLTGEQRTGCMFCMFGVQFDKEPNRFQRMKLTHPKLYSYCMEQLGLRDVLDYMGIAYE